MSVWFLQYTGTQMLSYSLLNSAISQESIYFASIVWFKHKHWVEMYLTSVNNSLIHWNHNGSMIEWKASGRMKIRPDGLWEQIWPFPHSGYNMHDPINYIKYSLVIFSILESHSFTEQVCYQSQRFVDTLCNPTLCWAFYFYIQLSLSANPVLVNVVTAGSN